MKKFLSTKILALILSVAVAAGSVGAGGYEIYRYDSLPEKIETARVVETEAVPEVIEEEEEESIDEELLEEEDEEEEEETTVLTLVCTSMEKDLKIKIQNQKSKLVTGVAFKVNVTGSGAGAKSTTYEDKDKDGIIYIEKIDAGTYTVELLDVEGYEIKTRSVAATVKDQLEYKKVDVASEIKTESQVNTAVEDTAVNSVPVESSLKNTVDLIASSTKTTAVHKANVANGTVTVPKASAGSSVSSATLKKMVSETVVNTTNPNQDKTDGENTDSENTDGEKENNGQTDGENTDGGNTDGENTDGEDTPEVTQEGDPAPASEELEEARVIIYRNTIRTAAQDTVKSTDAKAEVQLPSTVTLYNSDNAESNSYTLTLTKTGDSSVWEGATVKWSCSKDSVVTLSGTEGDSVKVTRKAVGEAVVTATISYPSVVKDKEIVEYGKATVQTTITVKDTAAVDTSATLKDTSGNTLYLDEKATKVATVADYSKQDTFYTSPKYTGWQTIDGKVYYYNSDNKAVTGSQVIDGVSYSFNSDGSLAQSSGTKGIDVSKWQGNIDWGAVASAGISYAIIRVGYRGSSTGALIQDTNFKKNISGATKAGIKVGVYFFTQAITEAEAVEEASMVLSLVSGYKLTYPIFIDTESATNGRANGLSKSARTAIIKAFCQTIQNGGYKAGVYASKSWYNNQLNASALSGYCIWVAQYSSECTYSGKKDIWQYTSSGTVSGISGKVDMNISYTGY